MQNVLRRIVLRITGLAENSVDLTENEQAHLQTFFDFRELIELEIEGNSHFEGSGFPGYVRTSVLDKDWFIPCHLASVFPPTEVCNEISSLLESVALDLQNPVCLSGSATFLGELGVVGDIDFCEYGSGDAASLSQSAGKKAAISKDALLVECKCDADIFTAPWENLETGLNASLCEDSASGQTKPFNLDFLARSKLGIMPTTLLILKVFEDDYELGNALRSHPFQEAVISGVEPPRQLANISSFGRYTGFLLEEAEALLNGRTSKSKSASTIKALKRLLSYVLLLGDTDLKDEIINGLEKRIIQSIVLIGRKAELSEMMRKIDTTDHPIVAETTEDISRLVSEQIPIPFTDKEVEEAIDSVKEIAITLLEDLKSQAAHYAEHA